MRIYSPALLDTNILVYYHQELTPFHSRAKGILEMGLRREVSLCICPQVLMEFYATITNPRRVTDPVPPEQGLAEVEKYFTCSWLGKIYPKEETLEITIDLLKKYRVSRMEVFDLQLVATMLSNGVIHIYTFNQADFVKYSEIQALLP
jgi:predicted nucleic acid-binding protein